MNPAKSLLRVTLALQALNAGLHIVESILLLMDHMRERDDDLAVVGQRADDLLVELQRRDSLLASASASFTEFGEAACERGSGLGEPGDVSNGVHDRTVDVTGGERA